MYGFESRPGHHMSWGNVAVGSARPRPMCTKCAQDVLAVRRRCADGGDAQHRRSEVAGLGEVLHGQGCRAGADSVPAARTHRCLPAPPDYAPTEVAFCAPIGRISCAPVRRNSGAWSARIAERSGAFGGRSVWWTSLGGEGRRRPRSRVLIAIQQQPRRGVPARYADHSLTASGGHWCVDHAAAGLPPLTSVVRCPG